MLLLSFAKINLGLQIIEKRPDGFHNLQTVFFPIEWADVVEVLPARDLRLHASGLLVDAPADQNLCVKAFRLLQKDFCLSGADIYLHKQIPYGAGLGGGSSNAAAVLMATNRAFALGLNTLQLEKYAAQLGSDCPFFVHNVPMSATGRGEILSPAEVHLEGYYLLIVKPNVSVNTAAAYKNVQPQPHRPSVLSIVQQAIETWKSALVNDFEPSVWTQYPLLQEIKRWLYDEGALYASLSGSGSALFGIFNSIPPSLTQKLQPYTVFTQKISSCYACQTAN
ncbi:4-diphosphocytidyl-2-C-methyl-D-erythritol kinase [Bacteroidia bacterium]|nr:4-diphosphocytidyl-2-C-methyl-D-erythritol kinase [Bacteroidia bacterium]